MNKFKKNQNNLRKRGFTLIELLVVSTIIVILSAIGLVSFANAGQSARDSKRKADLETVRQALVLYRSDSSNGTYPIGTGGTTGYTAVISALTGSPSYLSTPTPLDPKNDSTYFYTYLSNGSTFSLSAKLEKTGSTYTLTNP